MREQNQKAIWAAWRSAGMESDDLYQVIKGRYPGKTRMRELTDAEIADLREFVTKKNIPFTANFRVNENELNMTVKQWHKIKAQMGDLGWDLETLKKWIETHRMVPYFTGNIEDIYPEYARNIITALERMREKNQRRALYGLR